MAPTVTVTDVTESKPLWEHLEQEHRAGYATRLSDADLVALHEKDHQGGSWRHQHPRR